MQTIPPPPDDSEESIERQPEFAAVYPRYAALRAQAKHDADLVVLDDQYADLDDYNRCVLDAMIGAAEQAATLLEGAQLARILTRLLHCSGLRPPRPHRQPCQLRLVQGGK